MLAGLLRLTFACGLSLVASSALAQVPSESTVRDSNLDAPDLGVWKRFVETPWKEYGTDGAVQHVLFTLTRPNVVEITVRTDSEVRARVIVKIASNRTARYCPLVGGQEACNANIAFDGRTVTFIFDDPNRLSERAVLVNPDMFVHSRELEGVKVEQQTYASKAFDESAAVRQAAYASMLRYKSATEEVSRRRADREKNKAPAH